MGEHHCSYHVDRHEGVMRYSMATAHDVVAAIHTEVENFKGELIQLCPESSACRKSIAHSTTATCGYHNGQAVVNLLYWLDN